MHVVKDNFWFTT